MDREGGGGGGGGGGGDKDAGATSDFTEALSFDSDVESNGVTFMIVSSCSSRTTDSSVSIFTSMSFVFILFSSTTLTSSSPLLWFGS